MINEIVWAVLNLLGGKMEVDYYSVEDAGWGGGPTVHSRALSTEYMSLGFFRLTTDNALRTAGCLDFGCRGHVVLTRPPGLEGVSPQGVSKCRTLANI